VFLLQSCSTKEEVTPVTLYRTKTDWVYGVVTKDYYDQNGKLVWTDSGKYCGGASIGSDSTINQALPDSDFSSVDTKTVDYNRFIICNNEKRYFNLPLIGVGSNVRFQRKQVNGNFFSGWYVRTGDILTYRSITIYETPTNITRNSKSYVVKKLLTKALYNLYQ
jgi:hypothetical protein